MTNRHFCSQLLVIGCVLNSVNLYAQTSISSEQAVSKNNEAQSKTNKSNKSTASKIETITVLGKNNVLGAKLGGTNLKELAINSHVVGRTEMERLQFVDPDEFLDRIPGETQVRNLRIPNGGKGYTIPMLDGIPLENPYEGATQRLDRTNTFDIERVEVIKGPASALYPNNAFGGVVNVISRSAPLTPETKVSLETGDFDRLRAGVSTGGKLQDIGYLINLNTRKLNGLREEYINDKNQFSAKFTFNASEFTKISTRLEYIDELKVERGDLTALAIKTDKTQAGSLSSSTDIQQDVLALKVEHLLASGLIEFDLVRREKDTVGASRFRGPQDATDIGYSAKVLYRYDFVAANLTGGYELYDGSENVLQYERNDLALAGPYGQYQNELTIDAYFLQYQIEASNKFTITAGARYEDISVFSTSYNQEESFTDLAPKLGLTYQVNPDNMLWLGLSKGFYAPSTSQLFELENGNPDLAAEEAVNIELGFRGAWQDWYYDSSIYHNEISNYLVTQEFVHANGDEYHLTTNAGQVSIAGIESVVEYNPKKSNWRFGVTHTFTDNTYDTFVQSTVGAEDDLSGKVLMRSPKHHLNSRIAWLPWDSLTIELEADIYSHYFADNENSPEAKFTRGDRINLRVNYQLDQWRFWLHGLNLTDTLEDRATFSRREMKFRTIDGRTFYAGASYTF